MQRLNQLRTVKPYRLKLPAGVYRGRIRVRAAGRKEPELNAAPFPADLPGCDAIRRLGTRQRKLSRCWQHSQPGQECIQRLLIGRIQLEESVANDLSFTAMREHGIAQGGGTAVVQEARTNDPIVLVQDYHFALLPRMIRELLPNATIITFWHIPWPNPESFAICPWREELLDGLLGSSILGFHTQFHCNNFVDSVDRLLEARVDRETFSVSYRGAPTSIKRYPISIEWPPSPALMNRSVAHARATVRDRYGLPHDHRLGVGVERLDYTKGIEERFRAIERFLELHPEWVGKFSFVQIAAPSRSSIEEYHGYEQRVRALAGEINARFGRFGPAPIILKIEHHEPDSIYEYYRAADLCFVSSLHDGMNLVAKEFVAARDDERGVLVLSRFTGAVRELPEALVVNPYDADECAAALEAALTMPETEQRDRMRLMRAILRDFNVFRWAGRMLIDASDMRRRERLRESSLRTPSPRSTPARPRESVA